MTEGSIKDRRSDFSKKDFVSCMEKLKDTSDLTDKVNHLFRESRERIEGDFLDGNALSISHESLVVKLLETIMEDFGEWIGYYIYELDYGRKYVPGCITDADGTDIELDTAEKLYDFLVSEQNYRKQ